MKAIELCFYNKNSDIEKKEEDSFWNIVSRKHCKSIIQINHNWKIKFFCFNFWNEDL